MKGRNVFNGKILQILSAGTYATFLLKEFFPLARNSIDEIITGNPLLKKKRLVGGEEWKGAI